MSDGSHHRTALTDKKIDFTNLRPAEVRVLECATSGKAAVIQPEKPQVPTTENTVRAEFICLLALGKGTTREIHELGIHVHGAWIVGLLSIENSPRIASLTFCTSFFECDFELINSTVNGSIILRDSTLRTLTCRNSDVRSDILLENVDFYDCFIKIACKNELVKIECSNIYGNINFSARADNGIRDKFVSFCLNNSFVAGDIYLGPEHIKERLIPQCGPTIVSGTKVNGNVIIRSLRIESYVYRQDSDFLLQIDHCNINKNIRFLGQTRISGAHIGGLSMRHCTIGGNVSFGDTAVSAPAHAIEWLTQGDKRSAFTARFSSIGGSLTFGQNFSLAGVLYLSSINVNGRIDFYGADLRGNGFYGAEINNIQAGVFRFQNVITNNFPIRLIVSHVRTLADDEHSWPDKIDLDGFTYERLLLSEPGSEDDDNPVASRKSEWKEPSKLNRKLRWLKKQHNWTTEVRDNAKHGSKKRNNCIIVSQTFKAQPWIQLRDILLRQGEYALAREIGIAFERARMTVEEQGLRFSLSRRNPLKNALLYTKLFSQYKIWRFIVDFLIRFGYKPQRLFYASISVVFLSSILYYGGSFRSVFVPTLPSIYKMATYNGKAYKKIYCKNWMDCSNLPEEYPQFSAFWYSLNVFLPVTDFQQESHWEPSGHSYLGILILEWKRLENLFGWLVGLLLISAVSSFLKRRDE